jgi:hypothetical protein
MTIMKSMRGQTVDFTKLLNNNNKQIALNAGSGILMNARGDIVDSKGNVIKSLEEIEKSEKVSVNREKISFNNSEKMKKFIMKRKFMTPDEIQENIRKMEKEKEKYKENKENLLDQNNIDNEKMKIFNNIENEDENGWVKYEENEEKIDSSKQKKLKNKSDDVI